MFRIDTFKSLYTFIKIPDSRFTVFAAHVGLGGCQGDLDASFVQLRLVGMWGQLRFLKEVFSRFGQLSPARSGQYI